MSDTVRRVAHVSGRPRSWVYRGWLLVALCASAGHQTEQHVPAGDPIASVPHEQLRARGLVYRVRLDRPQLAAASYYLGIIARDAAHMGTARAHFSRYLQLDLRGPHASAARVALVAPVPASPLRAVGGAPPAHHPVEIVSERAP